METSVMPKKKAIAFVKASRNRAIYLNVESGVQCSFDKNKRIRIALVTNATIACNFIEGLLQDDLENFIEISFNNQAMFIGAFLEQK